MNLYSRFDILDEARRISQTPKLDILDIRRYIGVPLAQSAKEWMSKQPVRRALCVDLCGVRAITASVAEELGPLLMQAVEASPALDQRYPVYKIDNAEHAYTFGVAFSNLNWTGLALVDKPTEPAASLTTILQEDGSCVMVLGQISNQMEQILRYADERFQAGERLTSDMLSNLPFLQSVSPAARSKRLTELYARRLLAFDDNPQNQKERLFIPVWRL